MSERHRRLNVHSVMLCSELEMAVVKLQADREIGKAFAVLHGLTEGLFRMGYLSREDYDPLIQRYSRKHVDVMKEKRAERENSHVPVLTLEKQREKQFLDQKNRQFLGQISQWREHPSPEWRKKVIVDAEKFKTRLESAAQLLELAHSEGA